MRSFKSGSKPHTAIHAAVHGHLALSPHSAPRHRVTRPAALRPAARQGPPAPLQAATLDRRRLAALAFRLPAQVVAIPAHAFTQPPATRSGLNRDSALAKIGTTRAEIPRRLAKRRGAHGFVVILHGMTLNQRRRTWKRNLFRLQ